MKILVLLPGKMKPKVLVSGETEYIARLKRNRIETESYRDEKVSGNVDTVRKAEATRLLKVIAPTDFLVACDERGMELTTPKLTQLIKNARINGGNLSGRSRLVFLIGGAHGLDESIRQRANQTIRLSGLVMAGGVARIVLLEALYRACAIIDNHPYHNE